MGNEKLSQEEINALLETANSVSAPKDLKKEEVKENEYILSDLENDAIGELGNISMGSAATAISTLLGKKVEITTPSVKERNISDVRKEFKGEKIVVRVDYIKSLVGTNAFVIEPHVGAVIADIMMGGTGENVSEELDDIKLSAVGEAMNQMMGAAATALSEVVKGPVDITPPKIEKVNFDEEKVQFPPVYDGEEIVEVRFKIKIDGILSGDMMQLMSPTFAKNFASHLTNSFKSGEEEKKEAPPVSQQSPSPSKDSPQQPVKKAEFQEFEEPASTSSTPSYKLDTLLDIPLEISVELGHTTMTLKQILDSGVGTLIELDKLTGEPVDILVNGKPVAEGEVVVIGENFGVRITKILSKKERLYTLK